MFARYFVTCCICIFSHYKAAFCLFLDDKRQNRPVFIEDNDYSVYFTVGGGVTLWPNMSDITTLNLADSSTSSSLSNVLGAVSNQALQPKYAPYLNIAIGYKNVDSIVRHELEFTYLEIVSDGITGLATSAGTALNGQGGASSSVSFLNYDGRRILSIGAYERFFKLLYKPYLHFDNLLSVFGQNFDVFVGGGIGFAVVTGGVYAGSEYTKNSQGNWTTDIQSYSNNTYSDASGRSLVSMKDSFAIACEVSTGLVYNITSVIATQLKLKYAFVSKPLFGVDFSSPQSATNTDAYLVHFLGLELGLLFRAF